MGKNPAFQFYPGDWVQDTKPISLAAKGAWIDLLCAMWRSQTKGKLSLPMIGYARLLGASVEQTEVVIKELIDMQICNAEVDGVSVRKTLGSQKPNSNLTLINRRMFREGISQENNRLRQKRFYDKQRPNGIPNKDLTPLSSSSSSIPPIIPQDPNAKNGSVPHQEILSLWREILPEKTYPKAWNATRGELLRARWREEEKRQNLDYWRRLFTYLRESPFLMGERQSPGRKPFVLTLPWLLKSENFLKVIEGNYHR
jgi:hypothetical protein